MDGGLVQIVVRDIVNDVKKDWTRRPKLIVAATMKPVHPVAVVAELATSSMVQLTAMDAKEKRLIRPWRRRMINRQRLINYDVRLRSYVYQMNKKNSLVI